LLPDLTSRDLAEWMAYSRIEPFGMLHEELLNAILAATVANAFGTQTSSTFEPTDFMPSYEPPPQDWRSIKRGLQDAKALTDGNRSTP